MNPQAPAPAPAPGAPVSDQAALAGIINTLGPAPAPTQSLDFGDVGVPPVDIMPQQVPAPQAPQYAPAPQPMAPQIPQQVQQPQYQQPQPQYQPQYPQAPAAIPQQQPQAPQIDPNNIPLPPMFAPPVAAPQAPAAPAPTGEQVPAWAQGLVQTVQSLQQSQQAGDWKPNDWQDVDARIEARARELVQTGLTEQQQQQLQTQQAADAARTQADQFIDQQINQLQTTGYLPPIANPQDPADVGRAAQQELFAYALSLGTDNLMAVAPNLYALHQTGYFFDKSANRLIRRGSQTAAANAPIAGSAPNFAPAPGAPGQGPTMQQLATMDLSSLAEMANRSYPIAQPQ